MSVTVLPSALVEELDAAGYFPRTAADCLRRALRAAVPVAYLVRPETTFDGTEVRRHMTVLVVTARHLVITHLDDDQADELNPGQVVATTERVRLDRISATGVSQVFDTEGPRAGGTESEITLGLSWGGSRRIDLDRAVCDDPQCQADHGYSGSSTEADLTLRISALADGPEAVAAALRFHEDLLDAIDGLDAPVR